jgi:hypothetical protein
MTNKVGSSDPVWRKSCTVSRDATPADASLLFYA